MTTPLPYGSNGRESSGRFAKGNAGGPGNPYARQVAEMRAALMSAITPEDIVVVIRALIDKAKAGDVIAAREVFDRVLGKATATVEFTTCSPEPTIQSPEEIIADWRRVGLPIDLLPPGLYDIATRIISEEEQGSRPALSISTSLVMVDHQ